MTGMLTSAGDSTDLVAEALTCLPPGQIAAIAKSADRQADTLAESGQEAWSLIWRAVAVTADRAGIDQVIPANV